MGSRIAFFGSLTLFAFACGSEVVADPEPSCTSCSTGCDPALAPACGSYSPLCVDGTWTCDGCDPQGVGAADCWDECHGMHAPICEDGVWGCLDPNAGGCAAAGGSSTGGGGSGGGGSGGSSASCADISESIAALTSGVVACTTAVRLDYQSLDVLGFQIFCGSYDAVTESEARARAESMTGYGQSAQLLSGANPEDEWVFWVPAGDFGGTGVVSAKSGMVVFGASTVWGGTGDIDFPDSWMPASAIGPSCIPETNALPPAARGFDLGTGEQLTAPQVEAAMDEAWVTALPDGLMTSGYVFESMVLLYPRSIGAFDPTSAEWIVLVNSGWLE